MDQAGVRTAAICGVSYGGLVASAFAARHPDRVSSLVLVSAIPPAWRPDARARFFLRAPWLLSPLFVVSSLRLYPEIAAAVPGAYNGFITAARHAWLVVTHMLSPGRTARRVRLLAAVDLEHELRTMRVPTMIVTGEAALDRVVPVRLSHEYLRMWPHAHAATIARTGHLGLVTRPDEFAATVCAFVAGESSKDSRHEAPDESPGGADASADARSQGRRVG
jgi:3-oxoadipate enol-lactonase